MKTQLLLITFSLTTCFLPAADSIRFSERLADARVCVTEEGERFCEVVTRKSGSLYARLTIPGLSVLDITPDTPIELSLGGVSVSANWGDAETFSSNRVVFMLVDYDEQDRPVVQGSVTISRRGDVLTIVGNSRRLESSFVADSSGWDESGRGSVGFSINLGDLSAERTVYYRAIITEKPSSGEEEEPLRTIVVNGSADFKKPVVAIKTPRNRSRVTNEVATVTGTARDNVSVLGVLYRVGTNDWLEADGAGIWSAQVELAVGTNVVQVKSVDQDYQESRVARRTIIRAP